MTIHVNIGEAKTRLSELIASAVRGEDIVLDKSGSPQVRLVPVAEARDTELRRVSESRRKAFGMWKHLAGDRDIDIQSMKPTDEEWDEQYRRKFGDPG